MLLSVAYVVYADKYIQYMVSLLQSGAYKSTPRLTNKAATSVKIGVKSKKKVRFSKEKFHFHSQSGSSCIVQ